MLLDTSGLLCLQHVSEAEHDAAVAYFDASFRRVTHSYVLAEYVALAQARGFPRREALDFVADLQDTSEVEVIFVDEELHRAALGLLQRRLDKSWSLADAVSFVLMQRMGVTEALTTDHHFNQAGFVRLLTA
jgi:predicted nucleic acid-binding protein